MTVALLKWMYGDERINYHINMAEYAPHLDPGWDPYSVIWNATGANVSVSFRDVVAPLGYE
jgi:hypothetical protein